MTYRGCVTECAAGKNASEDFFLQHFFIQANGDELNKNEHEDEKDDIHGRSYYST